MNNPILLNCEFTGGSCGSRLKGRTYRKALTALLPVAALLATGDASATENTAGTEAGGSVLFFTLFLLGAVGISILLIFGITRWGHRQDQIRSMMSFSIKYLTESIDEGEKIEAARALGDTHDPNALLILIDILCNEEVGEELRTAAVKSLQEMSREYHQYTGVIDDCIKAVEERNHQRLIDLLIENFEQQKRKYAHSAFLLGRQYMRIGQYADARIWLQYAKVRNKTALIRISQISPLIAACNQQLFDEGDRLFKTGEYRDALERYALASHNLALEEKRRHWTHIRLASIYCKLKHYEDAYQETLLALEDNHKTDTSLNLNKMLHEMRSETGDTDEAQARRDRLEAEIDDLVERVMAELI